MCCGNISRRGVMQPGHHGACFCGCEGAMQSAPRFVSKDRRISELKQHLADLKDEAKAVEEHIAQIRKEK